MLAGFLIFLLFSFLILIICISRKIKSWKVITSNRHNGNEGTYKHNNDDDFQLISIPLTPSANSQQQQQQQQVQEQPEVLDMSLFTREPTRRAAPLHPQFLPKKPPAPMPKSILSQKTVHFNEWIRSFFLLLFICYKFKKNTNSSFFSFSSFKKMIIRYFIHKFIIIIFVLKRKKYLIHSLFFSFFLSFSKKKTFFTIIPLFHSIYLFVYLFILSFKFIFSDKFRIFY